MRKINFVFRSTKSVCVVCLKQKFALSFELFQSPSCSSTYWRFVEVPFFLVLQILLTLSLLSNAAYKIFHTLSHEQIAEPASHSERQNPKHIFQMPHRISNVNLFFFAHDAFKHASRDIFGFETGQNPAKSRSEALEKPRINVIGIEIGQFNWRILEEELLS